MVYPHLTYCIEAYANTNKTNLQPLRTVNNTLLRILLFESLYTPLKTLYSSFNTLDIELLFQFHILKFVYKWIHCRDQLPFSFKYYFELASSVHGLNLRTSNNLQIYPVNTSLGERNLKIFFCKLWNKYPSLHNIVNVKSFMRELYDLFQVA